MKIKETQSTLDTNPSNYVGYEIDDKTGKRKKKDKDMNDKELHVDSPPDGPTPPVINVQAEAYKPGFVIYLVEEPLDDAVYARGDLKPLDRLSTAFNKTSQTKSDAAWHVRSTGNLGPASTSASKNLRDRQQFTNVGKAADRASKKINALTLSGDVNSKNRIDNSWDKYAVGDPDGVTTPEDYSRKTVKRLIPNKNESAEDPLKTLNHMHHLCETYPQVKMVFEDTTTGEKGYITPAMFVKIYSKMLQDGMKQEIEPMSESKTQSRAANLPLATELMNIGLVNNVKGTAKVLREENPMRQAMEIFYASEKSNANVDEKKAEYVPSQLKEGKMVLEKSTKPSGASTDTSSDTASKTATKTATKTSTDAYTQGNVTVTGGAGAGATSVTISIPRGDGGDPAQRAVDAKPKPTKSSKKQEEEVTPKPKRLIIW